MTDAASWIETRAAGAPEALRKRMRGALAETPAEGASGDRLPQRLADVALGRLRAALGGPAERAAAIDLLAADALLTYACEAAAERGPAALAALTDAYGPGRIAELLTAGSSGDEPASEDA